ncbi:MAG: hypothetical protein AAF242_15765, partial [Bacteroidota bacterium]
EEIELDNGIKLNFESSSLIRNDGSSFEGTADVYVRWLDPTEATLQIAFPLDYEVISSDNEIKLMEVFSGLTVELYDGSEQLQIRKPVKVSIPVPSEIVNQAPATIHLAHLEDEANYWKQEGTARLENSSYVFEATSFSSWCTMIMQDAAFLTGIVAQEINDTTLTIPAADLFIEVKLANNNNISAVTRTLANGIFSMKVPANQDLVVNVYGSTFNTTCGNILYTENIPGFDNSLTLDYLRIEPTALNTIFGTVVDCDNQVLTNGYVIYKNADRVLGSSILPDGSFSISMYPCETEIVVQAYNAEGDYKSEELFIPSLNDDVDLGYLIACEVNSVPPYFLRVETGGDRLIGSAAEGSFMYPTDGDGNYNGLILQYSEMDIENTTQPLNTSAVTTIIYIEGFEDQACNAYQCLISIPLLDSENTTYEVRVNDAFPWSNINTYNCVENADYLHFQIEGALVHWGSNDIVTHRDSVAMVDVFFPL